MTTIKLKNGSGAPTAGDLVQGEPALDLTNKRLYTEDSGGTVIEVGTNPGEDVTFADNRKAVFGAGSDLQIYHDGTHSYVSDQGTGNLRILAENFQVRNPANNEAMIIAIPDSGVTLYHDNTAKLATTSTGIDVTGTVTADGLTLGSEGDQISIPTSAGFSGVITTGDTVFGNAFEFKNGNGIVLVSDTNDSGATGGVDATLIARGSSATKTALFDANGDISFYEDTGTTAKLFWDASAESLGIGTSSPSSLQAGAENLVVGSGSGDEGITIYSGNTSRGNIYFADGTTSSDPYRGQINYFHDSDYLRFVTAATERMRIDSSGQVGIGTSSPSEALEISADIPTIRLTDTFDSSYANIFYNSPNLIFDSDAGNSDGSSNIQFRIDGTERLKIKSTGNVGIGTSNPSQPLHVDATGGTTAALFDNNGTNGDVVRVAKNGTDILKIRAEGTADLALDASGGAFIFKEGGAEAMRIDASGNLLVGATTTTNLSDGTGNDGVQLNPSGTIAAARTSNVTAVFNRLSTDGEIARFNKDGTTVGSIGTAGGQLNIGLNTTSGLQFGTSLIYPRGTGNTTQDGTIDLGNSGNRFQDIYATNGTIQTSDRNEKQDIEALSDAEQRVAVAAKGLLRKFRWIDSVEEKGDEARIHFGIIAQDLQDAFTAEGLDAGRYGMFINSTWTDEETGEERSRMGVRYSELLAFIIAAI